MKKVFVIFAVIAAIFTITYLATRKQVVMVDMSEDFSGCATGFKADLVERFNDDLVVTVNGLSMEEFGYESYISDSMKLVVDADFLRSLLNCSVLEYPDGKVLIMKGNNKLETGIGVDKADTFG